MRSIVEQNKANPLLSVELDEAVVRNVSLYARTELSPLCALFGGVLAQEITKQAGKYTPISQWFHFDAFELLSPTVPSDATPPTASRYSHQVAVFGSAFQQRLGSQRVFLVGCGALGCEYMKSFAMMGLGCAGGEVTVTDDDRIELSNLSRQFLFRRRHVGLAKSISAGEAAVQMNPQLKACLKTLETRVEPKSENVFDDRFWNGLDFVVNALDNQQARKYTDGKCVLHLKPLFESGTLGTQGTQRHAYFLSLRCAQQRACTSLLTLSNSLLSCLGRSLRVAVLSQLRHLPAPPDSVVQRGRRGWRGAGHRQVHSAQLPF